MLQPKSFAVTVAVFWGFTVFWIVLLANFGLAEPAFRAISSLYFGWIPKTGPGVLLGTACGAADGLIGGYLFAWLYNLLAFRERMGQG